MVRTVSDCVGCQMPCMGTSCPHYEAVEMVCDHCGEVVDKLFWFDGEQICEDCLLAEFDEVEPDVVDDCPPEFDDEV